MPAKVRISNWISPEAKAHLSALAKKKKLPQSEVLEIAIKKLK
jgi:hypothetical protein